jgi:hypothetical protein
MRSIPDHPLRQSSLKRSIVPSSRYHHLLSFRSSIMEFVTPNGRTNKRKCQTCVTKASCQCPTRRFASCVTTINTQQFSSTRCCGGELAKDVAEQTIVQKPGDTTVITILQNCSSSCWIMVCKRPTENLSYTTACLLSLTLLKEP